MARSTPTTGTSVQFIDRAVVIARAVVVVPCVRMHEDLASRMIDAVIPSGCMALEEPEYDGLMDTLELARPLAGEADAFLSPTIAPAVERRAATADQCRRRLRAASR